MNIKSISGIVLLGLLLSCRLAGQQDEFVIREGSDTYYSKGQLEKCYLKEDAVVDSFTCSKWIHYYEDGALRRFTLTEPASFRGIDFPARSTLFLTQSGMLEKCWFGKKTVLNGMPLIGGYRNITITFFEDGLVSCAFLSKKHVIQGIPCKKGVIHPVFFYPSGNLKRCTVGKKVKIQNMELKEGTVVELNREGRITSTSER